MQRYHFHHSNFEFQSKQIKQFSSGPGNFPVFLTRRNLQFLTRPGFQIQPGPKNLDSAIATRKPARNPEKPGHLPSPGFSTLLFLLDAQTLGCMDIIFLPSKGKIQFLKSYLQVKIIVFATKVIKVRSHVRDLRGLSFIFLCEQRENRYR